MTRRLPVQEKLKVMVKRMSSNAHPSLNVRRARNMTPTAPVVLFRMGPDVNLCNCTSVTVCCASRKRICFPTLKLWFSDHSLDRHDTPAELN